MAFNKSNALLNGNLLSMEEIIQAVLNAAQDRLRTESELTVGGVAVSASNPVPVDTEAIVTGTYVDGSGTIAAGGTAEEVFAANASRKYLFITNPSDTEMWINFGVAAVASQPSIRLAPNGGYFEPLVPSGQSVSIFCATTGKAFVAKEA